MATIHEVACSARGPARTASRLPDGDALTGGHTRAAVEAVLIAGPVHRRDSVTGRHPADVSPFKTAREE